MGEITGKSNSSEYTDEDIATLAGRLDEMRTAQAATNEVDNSIDAEEITNEVTDNAEG